MAILVYENRHTFSEHLGKCYILFSFAVNYEMSIKVVRYLKLACGSLCN